MPAIPRYVAQNSPQGSLGIGSVDTGAEQIARGVSALGSGLREVGSGAYAIEEANAFLNERAAAAADAESLGKEFQRATVAFNAAKQSAAPDADKFTPGFMRELEKEHNRLIGEAKTPQSRQRLTERLSALRNSFFDDALRWETSTRQSHQVGQQARGLEFAASGLVEKPERYLESLAEQYALLDDMGLDAGVREERKQATQETLALGAALGAAQKDPTETLQKLREATPDSLVFGQLSGKGRVEVEKAARQAAMNGITGEVMAAYEQGMSRGDAALAGLAARGLDAETEYEVRKDIRERVNLLRDERSRLYAKDLAAIETELSRKSVSGNAEERIAGLYQRGAISEERFAKLTGRVAGVREAVAVEDAEADGIRQALAAGGALDPKNAEHKKYADSLFLQNTRTLTAGSPEWTAVASDIVTRTGILPATAGAWLRTAALGGQPEQAAQSAELLNTVAAVNPLALSYIDEDTKAFGLQVSNLLSAGARPAEAVEAVRKAVYGQTHAQKQQSTASYKKQVKDPGLALNRLLSDDNAFDPGVLSGPPAAPDAMVADFNSLASAYYASTGGNLEAAQKLAYQDLKSKWARSTVNGRPEVLRYAPELFGVPASRVRDDLRAAFGERADRIRVVPDALTERTTFDRQTGQANALSWALIEIDPETGATTVLDERWAVPGTTDITAEIAARRQRNVEAARATSARKKQDAVALHSGEFSEAIH